MYDLAVSQNLSVCRNLDGMQIFLNSELDEDFIKIDEGFHISYFIFKSDEAYLLKIDFQYPENLHNLHNILPVLPERKKKRC